MAFYTAQGELKQAFSQPAYIDSRAKKAAWEERSAGGFPLNATEWQSKGKEKMAWVAGDQPQVDPQGVDAHRMPGSQKGCVYSAQGSFMC
jgi:hypothetical protein